MISYTPLRAVKKSFKIAVAKGFKSRFGRDERKEIIAAVCSINHAIFDVTLMVGSNSIIWPLIDVGAENIHPLRDPRVAVISQQSAEYIGYYPVQWTWSFGMDILKSAKGICTNTKVQFIVGDMFLKAINVFDCDGSFLRVLKFDRSTLTVLHDVATDQDGDVYLLCEGVLSQGRYQVRIFDKNNNMHRSFVVSGLEPFLLTVVEKNSKQVLVVGKQETSNPNFVVNVYEPDGTFVRSFLWADEFFRGVCQVRGITACNDGRVMVLNQGRVYVFSAEGDCLYEFSVGQETNLLKELKAGAILWANEHVIIVSIIYNCPLCEPSSDFDVSIYTEDGKLVYNFSISSCYPVSQLEPLYIGDHNKQTRTYCLGIVR